MSLKNPWEVSSKPKTVPVYADGERIGTAESASVNLTGFYGPITSVELTGLSDRPVPVSLLQRNYDVAVRDRKIEELESEVERLRQSRKEQTEKHKQKMRNLQMNFEQRSAGAIRNVKLKKQLENSQSYNEHLKELISELQADLEKAEQQRQSVADQNVNLRAESGKLKRELQASKDYAQTLRKTIDRQTSEINSLNSKLRRERGNDSYWHEKYLESEKALDNLRDEYVRLQVARTELARGRRLLLRENKQLVDEYNRLNDDINRFMEDFSRGAMTISRAVDDWNATVPE